MKSYESLNHTKWECKYHVVFIPKYRRQALYGQLRKELGEVFHDLAKQRESKIERKSFAGHHFWVRGYFVSTVGADEVSIREYIRNQEREDKRLDQMNMF